MTTITEGGLCFEFPQGWAADKFDDWDFYRKTFAKIADAKPRCSDCKNELSISCGTCGRKKGVGTKGIDILAIGPDSTCWQIEVKDYRLNRKPLALVADEVALKVRDTLACLVAAKMNSNDARERKLADASIQCKRIRVVLHFEQSMPVSRLSNANTISANILARMKQLLKGIDASPLVTSMARTQGVEWAVTQV